jgi:dynactin 1
LEDLKQQLDDALGAEDLVDQLTEKNLNLTEKLEEMRGTVDDLEALKELADELEENHVETEKQLEAEIGKPSFLSFCLSSSICYHHSDPLLSYEHHLDHRDMLLREQLERLRSSEETAADYESTIQQFRELVTLLQR